MHAHTYIIPCLTLVTYKGHYLLKRNQNNSMCIGQDKIIDYQLIIIC